MRADAKCWAREAVLAQEIVFSICMGSVAVLSRGNPALRFPQVLWAFAGLLAFNLLYHLWLRRSGDWKVALVSMAVNTVLITAVQAASGGSESTFWPMYLLPIFTACLHLRSRHAAWAALSSCAFLSYFYIDALFSGPAWLLLPLAVKAGVLALSATVTAQFACRERKAKLDLAATRLELDRLSGAIAQSDASGGRAASRRRFLEGIFYDVSSQLMAISGSAEVLLEQSAQDPALRPDIERIAASAGSLRTLTAHVLSLMQSAEPQAPELSLERILSRATALLDYKLKHRGLSLSLEVPHNLPKLAQSPHLELSLLDLLLWVMAHTAQGGQLTLKAQRRDGDVELVVAASPRAEDLSLATLAVHEHALARDQVGLHSRQTEQGLALRLLLRTAARERA